MDQHLWELLAFCQLTPVFLPASFTMYSRDRFPRRIYYFARIWRAGNHKSGRRVACR